MLETQVIMLKFLAVLNLLPGGSGVEFAERPINGSVRIGDSLTLKCSLRDFQAGEPLPVQWMRNGVMVNSPGSREIPDPGYSLQGSDLRGQFHLHIDKITMADHGKFECQMAPKLRARAHITVLVPPSNMSLSGSGIHEGGSLIRGEGRDIAVDCTTTGSRPAAELAWYKNGKRVDEGVEISRSEDELGLVTTTASLKLVALGADHKAQFVCQAKHEALPPESAMRSNFTLSVQFSPGTPYIAGYTSGEKVVAGSELKLRCRSDNGNPPMTLFWLRNGRIIDQDFVTEERYTENEYAFTVAAEDNDAEFRCEAANSFSPQALPSSVRLQVHCKYTENEYAFTVAAEDNDAEFRCEAANSFSPQALPSSVRLQVHCKYTENEYAFTVAAEDNDAEFRCEAANSFSPQALPSSVRLQVHCKYTENEYAFTVAAEDNDAEFRCEAANSFSPQALPSSVRLQVHCKYTENEYAFTVAAEDNDAEFRCEAANSFSPQALPSSVRLQVHCKYTENEYAFTVAAEDNDAEFRCEAANSFSPQALPSSVRLQVHCKYTENEYAFTVAAEDNDAEFRCEAANSFSPQALPSSVRLQVHFAPSAVRIEGPSEVRAGSSVGLRCVGEPSHPTARIDWIIDGKPHHDDTLIIRPGPHGGSVSMSNITVMVPSGSRTSVNVACVARNPDLPESDRVSAKHELQVHYPPNALRIYGAEDRRRLVAGTKHVLTCEADGGFPAPKLTWFRGTRKKRKKKKGFRVKWDQVRENIKTEMRGADMTGSELVLDPVSPDDNGALYRCEASSSALHEPIQQAVNLSVHYAPSSVRVWIGDEKAASPPRLRAGKVATVSCESGASNPAPVLSWWLAGERLPSVDVANSTAAYGGFTVRNKLFLELTRDFDGRSYLCKAENPALNKGASRAITLDVYYPPAFTTKEPQSLTVLEGESVLFNYSASGKPDQVTYEWYKGGSEVRAHAGSLSLAGAALQSPNIQRSDAGDYVLVASNTEGKANLTLSLTVNYPATVEFIDGPIIVGLGESAELVCRAAGVPATENMVSWSREEFDFEQKGVSRSTRPFKGANESHSNQRQEGLLSITSASEAHSGSFLCTVANGIGESETRKATFLVRAPPRLHRSSGRAAGVIGQSALLRCRGTGVPTVEFSWAKDGPEGETRLSSDGKKYAVTERKVDLLTFESTLTIENITAEDQTTYFCIAHNTEGTDRYYVKLEEAGPPSPPTDVFAENVTANGVTLTWSPGFDGGLPQTFKIYFRRFGDSKGSQQRVPAIAPEGEHKFRLNGLRPLTRYELSVGAENAQGFTAYPQQPHISIQTRGLESGTSLSQLEEGLPTLVIILIVLLSVVLCLLNVCLIICLVRRKRRKKLKEKAASARLMDAGGPRPVQMFGSQDPGLRPDSQYTTVGTDSDGDHRAALNHSAGYSDPEEGSLRNVLERGNDGHVYLSERISPGSHQTYLLDDPYQALVPHYGDSPSNYADALRANSLQRRIAGGGTLTRAAPLHYAAIAPADYGQADYADGYPSHNPMGTGILSYAPPSAGYVSLDGTSGTETELPPAMGPLRHLQDELPNGHVAPGSPARGLPRRYSPTSSESTGIPTLVTQSGGLYSAAEVRPVYGQPIAPGTPVLSTFGQSAPRAKAEYADMDSVNGDLV